MVWFKVDDKLSVHPKIVSAGNKAIGLWVRAGSWSAANLTDGFVPFNIISVLGATKSDAKALAANGLWLETDSGWIFKDWEQYQPTAASVLADREAAAERMRRVRSRERSGEQNSNEPRTFAEGSPTPTRPDPLPTESKDSVGTKTSKRGSRIREPFTISDEMRSWAATELQGFNVDAETTIFVDYWRAAAGARAVKADWVATWRLWMRRAFNEKGTGSIQVDPLQAQTVSEAALAKARWLKQHGITSIEFAELSEQLGGDSAAKRHIETREAQRA